MYSYVVSLTKEEALESKRRDVESANNWWDTLTPNERVLAKETLDTMFKQRACEHEWVDSLYYDITYTRCCKCDLTKD